MLFNSLPFTLGFLPITLAGYWLLAERMAPRLWWLAGTSILFYSYWDWRFTPLLVASIIGNWLACEAYFRTSRRAFVIGAIGADLLCLAAFKYVGFFADIVEQATGMSLGVVPPALPLGISFFTFHHIIYLADLLRRTAPRYSFRDYALYIALFPQILAGPLVRHSEIIHQFPLRPAREGWEIRLVQGIAFFLIGLGKKLFLADALQAIADPIFAKAGHEAITIGEAWTGALVFPLQVYFDFSGYTDMAIGLALMLGMQLPVNFAAPFNATSIAELWRRWHMTLMRFLRDYLFTPLGGNRRHRQLATIVLTFTLAGLWHGAGWTFILWGALQGLAIAAAAYWRRRALPDVPAPLGWALTIGFVLSTWFIFRAPSLAAAYDMFAAMIGQAPTGPLKGLRTILVAALLALAGPTSQRWVERLTEPRRWLAPVAALATVLALFKLADGPAYEFIYFHF